MSLHITPLENYELSEWSFTPMNLDTFGRRKTYFVFLTYGYERPEVRTFWIELEDVSDKIFVSEKSILQLL